MSVDAIGGGLPQPESYKPTAPRSASETAPDVSAQDANSLDARVTAVSDLMGGNEESPTEQKAAPEHDANEVSAEQSESQDGFGSAGPTLEEAEAAGGSAESSSGSEAQAGQSVSRGGLGTNVDVHV